MKRRKTLRQMMREKTVLGVGAQDPFSARLVEQAGFDAIYLGSYASAASYLAKPDIGLMTLTDTVMLARNMAKAVKIPIIVDIMEGYGNALHVGDAVQRLEEAGVAGVHIDDEGIPAACPFLPSSPTNQLISSEEMCGKIKAAVDARSDPDFLIIARSDVVSTMSANRFERNRSKYYEQVIERDRKYLKAGADAIFAYPIYTAEDCQLFSNSIEAPLVAVYDYQPPFKTTFKDFERAGFGLAIAAVATLYSAARGMIRGLDALRKAKGDMIAAAGSSVYISDDEFFDIIELRKYPPLYRRFDIE